jgi:hypothetical protein
MGKVTIQTVEIFWKVGQEASMEDMKRYKAHSYDYIGHIFSTHVSLRNETAISTTSHFRGKGF